jgi:hypothetical protein
VNGSPVPAARISLLLLCLVLGACQPADERPGQWLSGTLKPYPQDWTFAAPVPEIALQVSTPYLIPHSVTIWCAVLDGALYVAAARPETKHWPGWVDKDPNVRIRIGEDLFDVRLVPLEDEALVRRVLAVQAEKYGFDMPAGPTGSRYWRVTPRSG